MCVCTYVHVCLHVCVHAPPNSPSSWLCYDHGRGKQPVLGQRWSPQLCATAGTHDLSQRSTPRTMYICNRQYSVATVDLTPLSAHCTMHLTPHHTTQHNTTPHHTRHHHTTQHHNTPHQTPPHHTTPHHTIQHHSTPHHTIPHDTIQHTTPDMNTWAHRHIHTCMQTHTCTHASMHVLCMHTCTNAHTCSASLSKILSCKHWSSRTDFSCHSLSAEIKRSLSTPNMSSI